MLRIGFTGTSWGMSRSQLAHLRECFTRLKVEYSNDLIEFHHGLCIGADEQAARLAKSFGFRVVAHPGYNPKNPKGRMYRSEFDQNDEVRSEKPFLKRDRDIVNETGYLIATPLTREEEVRSGTWTTIRYARKKRKADQIFIIYPEAE